MLSLTCVHGCYHFTHCVYAFDALNIIWKLVSEFMRVHLYLCLSLSCSRSPSLFCVYSTLNGVDPGTWNTFIPGRWIFDDICCKLSILIWQQHRHLITWLSESDEISLSILNDVNKWNVNEFCTPLACLLAFPTHFIYWAHSIPYKIHQFMMVFNVQKCVYHHRC